MNNYPYPVLTDIDSAYKDNIQFKLNCTETMKDKTALLCKLEYTLTSNGIKKMLDENTASLYLKYKTSIFSKMIKFEKDIIEIPYELIAETDTISLTLYIIAENNCLIQSSTELNEVYGLNYTFAPRKNDVLAVSNTEKLDYQLNGNKFIIFTSVDEQEGKGIKINCNAENYIYVQVGKQFNRAYSKLKSNTSVRSTIDAHIIFETIIYLLTNIAQNKEDYENKQWYSTFEQIMSTQDIDIDDFINKAIDNDKVDMDYIFEISQKLINNEIEASIIRIAHTED